MNIHSFINVFFLKRIFIISIIITTTFSCKKTDNDNSPSPPTQPSSTTEVVTQSGVIPLTQEDYAKLKTYVPNSDGGRLGAVTNMDLSGDMPPLNRSQGSQNSCTAWATCYALRSYLNHTDNNIQYGSVKNGIYTYDDNAVFSPAFVYNQLNTNNEGIKIPNALDLLLALLHGW